MQMSAQCVQLGVRVGQSYGAVEIAVGQTDLVHQAQDAVQDAVRQRAGFGAAR